MAVDLYTVFEFALKPIFTLIVDIIAKYIPAAFISWFVALLAVVIAWALVKLFLGNKISQTVIIIILAIFLYLTIMSLGVAP